MKYLLIWLLSVLFIRIGYGQVVINPQLPPAGLCAKEQLWNLSLMNSGGQSVHVQIEMQLSDVSTNQRILTAFTREFVLPKGIKQIRPSDIGLVTYNVVNSSYPVDASPNGLLPIGVFNVCYSVVSSFKHERFGEVCETIEVEPLSPPVLVLPYDQDLLDVSRPQFTWTPPAPINLFNRLSYDLLLVEVLPTQTPSDAIISNIPLLLIPDINFTNLQYPATLNELDTAKTYAWRIKAKNNGMHIANSETWTFKISKNIGVNKNNPKQFQYTKLSRVQDASLTSCDGELYFQYDNEINDTVVTMSIFDVTKSKRSMLINEAVSVQYGSNFKTVDLRDRPGLLNKHIYLLELVNAKEEKWYIKFQYNKK